MDDFARKQKQFLEQAMENEDHNMDFDSSRLRGNEHYDCVICNVCSPSTERTPMGLVVLVQATSVLGHRRRQTQPERDLLPTSEQVSMFLNFITNCSCSCVFVFKFLYNSQSLGCIYVLYSCQFTNVFRYLRQMSF